MRLTVVSSKRCWKDPTGQVVTIGGFPRQMRALAELFESARLHLPLEPGEPPPGAERLGSATMTVEPLPRVRGRGLGRKLGLLAWLARHGPRLARIVGRADAVHTPVPGDLGLVALLLAHLSRRPLLVRHCGTWGDRSTAAGRFLSWLAPRVARGTSLVLATGAGEEPPAASPNAAWIFSTRLSERDFETLPHRPQGAPRRPRALVSLGRLTLGKNVASLVEALPRLDRELGCRLTVIGEGPERQRLEALARKLGVVAAVRFTGNLGHEEVLHELAEADLLVFPTRVAEGFPKAVLEAMACGVPVLASSVSAIPWLLATDTPRPCGRLLESSDADAIVGALLDLAERPEELAAMSAAATARARAFTLERWAAEIARRLEVTWPGYVAPAGVVGGATGGDSTPVAAKRREERR